MKCVIKKCSVDVTSDDAFPLCDHHDRTLRAQLKQPAKTEPDMPRPTLGAILGAFAHGEIPEPDVLRSFVDGALQDRRARVQAQQQAQQAAQPARPQATPTQAALMVLGFDPRKPVPPEDVLKDRYRNLAKTYHPDRPAGDARKMQSINKAYAFLTSPK